MRKIFIPTLLIAAFPAAASSLPISTSGPDVSVQTVGDAETVFDHSKEPCANDDIPDLPAHAFRDASGLINLIATHVIAHRSVGSSWGVLKRDCNSIYHSIENKNFDALTYHEWLAAPYTENGTDVWALVHNEWYAYLVDPKCEKNHNTGWVNSITILESHDGGAHWAHPADYIVRKPPHPWSTSYPCDSKNTTIYGSFLPSNIIKKEDYYYAFIYVVKGKFNAGTCVIRTKDLSHGSGWETWTGGTWAKASDTPDCKFLDNLDVVHESITFNTYLGKYLMIGTKFHPTPGIHYSLSDDLLSWSKPVKIMMFPELFRPYQYPSLIDQSDSTRNFERSGREASIYLTYHNPGPDPLNRDLIRQKIRFTKDKTPPVVKVLVPSSENHFVTKEASMTLSAAVTDDGTIAHVTWQNETTGASGDAVGGYGWAAPNVRLARGKNIIIYTAQDLMGNIGTARITVVSNSQNAPPAPQKPEPISGNSKQDQSNQSPARLGLYALIAALIIVFLLGVHTAKE